MTNLISSISALTTLIRSNDSSGHPIDYYTAKKNAKILLTELVTVSAAIGGYFAVSALMNRMPTRLSAFGVGSLALAGALVITPKVSDILHGASLITGGLFIAKIGVVDGALRPLVQSVKSAMECLSPNHPEPFFDCWMPDSVGSGILSLLRKIGMGSLRGLGALVSGGVFFAMITKKTKNDLIAQESAAVAPLRAHEIHSLVMQPRVAPQRKFVDRIVHDYFIKTAALGLVRILGYRPFSALPR
ncbi:MAG TPA: hypothetical protein VMR37_02445 [Rhabdochlamydiaceae bacterium]|jgi:hypothetical protein|nr:hypothetical protein [Rhabdochlamydiaceae bacterium]